MQTNAKVLCSNPEDMSEGWSKKRDIDVMRARSSESYYQIQEDWLG